MFSIFYNKKQSAKEKCNRIVGEMSVNHPQEPEKELLESNKNNDRNVTTAMGKVIYNSWY